MQRPGKGRYVYVHARARARVYVRSSARSVETDPPSEKSPSATLLLVLGCTNEDETFEMRLRHFWRLKWQRWQSKTLLCSKREPSKMIFFHSIMTTVVVQVPLLDAIKSERIQFSAKRGFIFQFSWLCARDIIIDALSKTPLQRRPSPS